MHCFRCQDQNKINKNKQTTKDSNYIRSWKEKIRFMRHTEKKNKKNKYAEE